MREFHPKLARHSEREASAAQARTPQYLMHGGMPEEKLQWVQDLEIQGAWTEALPSVGAPFLRRHASPYCEIDTVRFVDRHDIHGSLPMVSENNTSIKKMVSNAENQVVGRCTAGNQALGGALRNPSCTISIFPNSC